jgi:hypothetical protein
VLPREKYLAAATKVSKRGERITLAASAKVYERGEREGGGVTLSVCNCRIGREAAKASPCNKPLLIRKPLTFSVISLITVVLGGKFFRITYK